MRITLHTWRYGREEFLEFHGRAFKWDAVNMVLEVADPVFSDGKLGKLQVMTVLSGEMFWVELCGSACPLHQISTDAERIKTSEDLG